MNGIGTQERREFIVENPEGRLRHKIREEQRQRLAKIESKHEREGRYLFEGKWLTSEEIESAFRELQRKHRQIFLEILLLLGSLAGFSLFLGVIVYSLCSS